MSQLIFPNIHIQTISNTTHVFRPSSLPISLTPLFLSSFTAKLEMLVKMKMDTVKKFAKKVKVLGGRQHSQQYQCLMRDGDKGSPTGTTPVGFFAVYVGEDRERFIVPMGFLSHPLFKMLLEKAYKEYGFEQRHGLVLPCSVSLFQEVVSAVECPHGQFDIEKLVDEFI